MGYSIAVALLVIGIFCQRREKTWACPETLFCYEWALISFLASLRLFGLYEACWQTWTIILIGSVSFVVGCCCGRMIKVKEYGGDVCRAGGRSIISEKAFWIFTAVIILYMIPEFIQSIHYMRQGYSLGDIRNTSVAGSDAIEGYARREGALWEYIDLCISVIHLLVAGHGISEYVKDTRKNVKYIAAVMVITLMQAFADGGRFVLVYVIIELLVCMNLNKISAKNFLSEKSMRLGHGTRRIVILLAAVVVAITLLRGAEVGDLLKKYYRYICGDVIFFDLHVESMDDQFLLSCTFAGFYGLWATVLPILNWCGISYPQLYLDTISEVMDGQTFLRIGDGLVTNAFITPFYHLYADFRVPGVIAGMLFFGIIAGMLYKWAVIRRDGYSVVCYLTVAQAIFKSLQMYPFSSKIYVLAFVVMWILGKKNKISFGSR